uniref:DUF4817 domain-containing protein n=1 Tax=Cacopsylla melanoneura TaxID=428564 RepID=A0A8D9F4Y6_9HEMI
MQTFHYVYRLADFNCYEAVREYRRQFPHRRIPDRRTFANVFQFFRDHGRYPNQEIRHERVRFRNMIDYDRVLEHFEENPHTSLRRASLASDIPTRTIHQF